jgi:hypothetical protein
MFAQFLPPMNGFRPQCPVVIPSVIGRIPEAQAALSTMGNGFVVRDGIPTVDAPDLTSAGEKNADDAA